MGRYRVTGRPALLAMIPAMLVALLYCIVRFFLDLLVQRQKGRGQPSDRGSCPREPIGVVAGAGPVLRRDRVGGVLHEYFRQAA